MIVCYSMKVIH